MTKPRILVLAIVTVLAGALLSAPSASVAAGATSGHQRFVLVQTDPNVEGGPIAATGVIHAKGRDVVLGEHRDRFKFPDGSVIIRHRPDKGSSSEHLDPVTCLFTFTERGTWKAARGTGAYEGVSGGGTYRVLGQGFGCNENKPPSQFFVRIVAKGHLSY